VIPLSQLVYLVVSSRYEFFGTLLHPIKVDSCTPPFGITPSSDYQLATLVEQRHNIVAHTEQCILHSLIVVYCLQLFYAICVGMRMYELSYVDAVVDRVGDKVDMRACDASALCSVPFFFNSSVCA
jgi:hypothetical protein